MQIITALRDPQNGDESDPLLDLLSGSGVRADASRTKNSENQKPNCSRLEYNAGDVSEFKSELAAHQSFQYIKNVVNGTIPVPKYVIKQCEKFLEICDGKSEKYFFDEQKLNQIDSVLKLLVMPRGLKAGSSIYEYSCGYQ